MLQLLFDRILAANTSTLAGSSIGFRIHGRGGGDWVLCFDGPKATVYRPPQGPRFERCDVRVYAFAEVFHQVLLDPTSIPKLMARGLMAIDGQREKLVALAQLIPQHSTNQPQA